MEIVTVLLALANLVLIWANGPNVQSTYGRYVNELRNLKELKDMAADLGRDDLSEALTDRVVHGLKGLSGKLHLGRKILHRSMVMCSLVLVFMISLAVGFHPFGDDDGVGSWLQFGIFTLGAVVCAVYLASTWIISKYLNNMYKTNSVKVPRRSFYVIEHIWGLPEPLRGWRNFTSTIEYYI